MFMMEVGMLNLDSHKLRWHQDRVNAWLRGERIAPITVDCALTRACTYKCDYCYSKTQYNKSKMMTKKNIYNFLDDAAEIGVKAVSFVSDGESTCHPNWVEAIIHGKANKLDMAIGTNGALMDKGDLVNVIPYLAYLRFNISAADRDRYCAIHGTSELSFQKVLANIRFAVEEKRLTGSKCTIGMQMVLLPRYADQIIPLTELAISLGVDYLVIKHCSDDEVGSLSVDYLEYFKLAALLRKAEAMSTQYTQIAVKWSKIMSKGERNYSRCYGAQFIGQYSGSGLVAPCGMLFNEKFAKYHIGNITEMRYKDIWKSQRYWDVMHALHSSHFDPRTMCGSLCLQHKANEYLFALSELNLPLGKAPEHINFI
jgi:MoaA/NifB/PqqE/SkfB family radical SAM enzyme